MLMRKIVIIFSVLMSCSAFAQKKMLHIVSRQNEQTVINLEKSPVLKILGDSLFVVTNDKNSIVFPLEDLKTYYLTGGTSTKIESPDVNADLSVDMADDYIKIRCSSNKATLTVYDVSGRKVYAATTDAHGMASIRKDILGEGTYIFKVNNNSIKYIVK